MDDNIKKSDTLNPEEMGEDTKPHQGDTPQSQRTKKRKKSSADHPYFILGTCFVLLGTLWLLIEFNAISVKAFYYAFQFWPILLIGGGLTLIVRRINYLKNLIWILSLILVVTGGYLMSIQHPIVEPFIKNAPFYYEIKIDNIQIDPLEMIFPWD